MKLGYSLVQMYLLSELPKLLSLLKMYSIKKLL